MKRSEEKEILEALEGGEIELERPSNALLKDLAKAAENTFKKDKRINIRLSNHDLVGIDVSAEGWDSVMVTYAHVYEHKGKTHMIYNGNGFGKSGFGYAVLT